MNANPERPVVASYCATFLKPEMLHIYRQITALRRVRPIVLAQKRECADRFPFDDLTIVPKPAAHFLRRIWFRQLRDAPWMMSRGESATVRHTLDSKQARLLHIYFGHIAVHLLPVIRRWQRPTVVSFHGADVMVDMQKPAYRSATLKMLEAVRLVLVRSESLKEALVAIGCASEKIRIQRTGIPLEEFRFQPRECPVDGGWRFLQACRLIPKKGLETSLRAFALFARTHPAAHFTIAGEGPMLDELHVIAKELAVAERVRFRGFVSQRELRELLYDSHIFLHPSETSPDGNQEGVPNSLLEAMATGLPVFATTHGGIPEAIQNRVSGVLVPEGDSAALAQELFAAVSNPEMLGMIARGGADAVREKFEQHEQTRRLEDCYFEAMQPSQIGAAVD